MIICPSSWRDIPVPENRLLLVKARALIIRYSGTDISYLYIPGEFSDSQAHGYLGGKRCFGLFFFTWGGNQKNPTTVKNFCSSNTIGQERFSLHFCVAMCSQCTIEPLCSHRHYKILSFYPCDFHQTVENDTVHLIPTSHPQALSCLSLTLINILNVLRHLYP